MSDNLVLYEVRSGTALLTINRPDRRNALSRGLIAALSDAFTRSRDDAAVRCVVLTGTGSAFCCRHGPCRTARVARGTVRIRRPSGTTRCGSKASYDS